MPWSLLHGLLNCEWLSGSGRRKVVLHVRLGGAVLAVEQLLAVELVVLLLQLAHLLNLVEVDHEAGLQVMHVFDALAAKD